MDDVVKRVERVFSNKAYVDSVSKSGKNWLDMPVEAVLKKTWSSLNRFEGAFDMEKVRLETQILF
ncbi:hypothetical protein [Butyrivibrio sp. NC3005]|uniref:hypothetical protein n=1 Tax=Butyrivibrio sp. NC3005 TaxID=1280685 RepID=UPI0004082E8B|nr:hypothetical protein [Butyrivibrio sp. NC3005]